MKSKGLLIALIVSLGINLGAVGTLVYHYIREANPKNRWKEWAEKYDETWEKVADSLEITPELAVELRAEMKAEFDKTKLISAQLKVNRDSLLELIKQPQLDTARLSELLAREAELQTEIGFNMFANLYETKLMLPGEEQELFIEFYRSSIKFTGKPWYISTKSYSCQDSSNDK